MKKVLAFGVSVVSGVVVAGAMTATAVAWHPEGKIKKLVQNQTANGALSDANDAKTAVATKPGDVLKYVIEVSNVGQSADNGHNDMTQTVMTDTLPAGVELVNSPSQRTITENLGTLKPGQKVTREYIVRVTSQKDKDVVTNKACFTGDSAVNDAPQKGCDPAVINVSVPKVDPPKDPPKTTTPQILPAAATTELPKTGAASAVGVFASISSLGYAAHRVTSRKRK